MGAANFLFQALSVRAGTPLGDVATFTSINMVIAAFLGRVFLGEALWFVHVIALFSSFGGAVLISKPVFIFGGAGGADNGWAASVGYLLALAAGFSQAAQFVCSRKSPVCSLLYHT